MGELTDLKLTKFKFDQ
jgi:kinesin family protein C1